MSNAFEHIEYTHHIKEKIGGLITKIAKLEGIPLSDKKRFRINYEVLPLIKPLYERYKGDATYRTGNDPGTPCTFDVWMEHKFPDLAFCIDVYEKALNDYITQQDLKTLNEIYKKYK